MAIEIRDVTLADAWYLARGLSYAVGDCAKFADVWILGHLGGKVLLVDGKVWAAWGAMRHQLFGVPELWLLQLGIYLHRFAFWKAYKHWVYEQQQQHALLIAHANKFDFNTPIMARHLGFQFTDLFPVPTMVAYIWERPHG